MPGPQINITIGGNTQQFTQAAAAAAAAANGISNAAQAAAAGIQRLPPAIGPAGRGLGQVGRDAISAASALNRIPPAAGPAAAGLNQTATAANNAAAALARARANSGQANTALTDFSRIIQDSPYGLIGITNNVTQLADSFGNLVRSSGGVGGAFRALFSSATGFGGIGLAISAITTALSFATIGFGAWTRGLGNNKKAADEATKATEEFEKSLKTVADTAGKSAGGVQGQIAQVRALANVITNTNNSYEQRKRALQELQQANKNYFGDLKLEEAQMKTLTDRVNEYTKALVQQAVTKGFESEISKVATGLYDQEKALEKVTLRRAQLRSELERTPTEVVDTRGNVQTSGRYQELLSQLKDVDKEFVKQRDVVEKGRSKFVELQGALSQAVTESLKFRDLTADGTDKSKKETDALKQRIDALKELRDSIGLTTIQQRELVRLEVQLLQRDGIKLGFTPQEMRDKITELVSATRFGSEAGAIKIGVPLLVTPTSIDVAAAVLPNGISNNAFDGVINAIRQSADNAKARVGQIAIDMKQFLAGALTGAFEGLGESIGNAISGGGFKSVISGFVSIIGDAISALGKAAIQAGTAALLLKKTLNSFIVKNPALVIAAGVAAVALGAALKNSFNNTKTPGFADGVTNFRGGAALVGERGPEIVTLPAGANVTPINPFAGELLPAPSLFARGDDLYISYNRTASRRRRI